MMKKGMKYLVKCSNCGTVVGDFIPNEDIDEKQYAEAVKLDVCLCKRCKRLPESRLKPSVRKAMQRIEEMDAISTAPQKKQNFGG